MKRGLILFLALCTFCAAMVPRDRRAVNSEEEEEELLRSQTTTSKSIESKQICAEMTPCAWRLYKPQIKLIEMNITNTYCVCAAGTVCQVTEDDSTVYAYVLRCRPPTDTEGPAIYS